MNFFKTVNVKFLGNDKIYTYYCDLELQEDFWYMIKTKDGSTYTKPVRVVGHGCISTNGIDAFFAPPYKKIVEANPIARVKSIEELKDTTTKSINPTAKISDNTISKDVMSHKNDGIYHVHFNEAKGVTVVVWNDGTKTIVKCQNNEFFDAEKGLALCYMKKALGNKSNFNDVLKRWCSVSKDETKVVSKESDEVEKLKQEAKTAAKNFEQKTLEETVNHVFGIPELIAKIEELNNTSKANSARETIEEEEKTINTEPKIVIKQNEINGQELKDIVELFFGKKS